MITEEKKSTSNVSYTYEQTDEMLQRASKRLLNYWSSFFNQMEDNENFLLSRFNMINNYIQLVKWDDYLENLYLVSLGSRSEGVSLEVALSRMEKVRQLIVIQAADNQESFAARIIPQILHDSEPITKIKYLMRFAVAMRVANLLYQKLNQQRLRNKKAALSPEFNFKGNPFMFADQLQRFLTEYK